MGPLPRWVKLFVPIFNYSPKPASTKTASTPTQTHSQIMSWMAATVLMTYPQGIRTCRTAEAHFFHARKTTIVLSTGPHITLWPHFMCWTNSHLCDRSKCLVRVGSSSNSKRICESCTCWVEFWRYTRACGLMLTSLMQRAVCRRMGRILLMVAAMEHHRCDFSDMCTLANGFTES